MHKTTMFCLSCVLAILLVATVNGQTDEKKTVTIQELHESSVIVRMDDSKIYKLNIEPTLIKEAGLKESETRMLYVSFKENRITGVQVGDQIVRQRDCSREDCRCEKYNCKPACHCRREKK